MEVDRNINASLIMRYAINYASCVPKKVDKAKSLYRGEVKSN